VINLIFFSKLEVENQLAKDDFVLLKNPDRDHEALVGPIVSDFTVKLFDGLN
jgi:hypothetical protein